MHKTLFIYSANYLPNIGGVEKYTYNLANQLELQGVHACIVTNNVFNLAEEETLESGATVYRLPCHPLISGRLPIPKRNAPFKDLLERIYSQPTDYVVVNTRFYPHTFLGVKHAERHNIKPIVIDHGSAYLTLGNPAIDLAVKAHEHLITALLKRHPIDFYGVSNESIKWLQTFGIDGKGVLNNSIDADSYYKSASSRDFRKELQLTKGDFLVSFTGRLIPEKGINELLETARKLSDKPNIKFALAGDGPLMSMLESNNPGNLALLGKLQANDIAALLISSDAFCLPTRSEGFSTSLLEAAACYTTPIITNVGGVPEMIPDDKFGIILRSQSSDEIAERITELQKSPELNSEIAQNIGRRVREEFSWYKTAEKTLQACKDANSNRADPNRA